jgi:hypothetical protein
MVPGSNLIPRPAAQTEAFRGFPQRLSTSKQAMFVFFGFCTVLKIISQPHCKGQVKKFFMHAQCLRNFLLWGKTVNGIIHRDMLQLWLMPQLLQDKPNVFQRDGASPHIHNEVIIFLNYQLSERWNGRGGGHFLATVISRSDTSKFSCEAF